MADGNNPIYIVLISIHGLIRGHDLELGRDADTGGQTKYVVELAKALAERDDVAQVDLITRKVVAAEISEDYAQSIETLGDKAQIVRIEAGPEKYIRKEELWDYMDVFADNLLDWLKQQPRMPDILHSHYADAGYVGMRMATVTGIPLVHTGHSLGRDKKRRLLANGLSHEAIENRYHMSRRIEAEEQTLAGADLVITSTHNEIEDQYEIYDYYRPDRMAVIPPGIDLEAFHPPTPDSLEHPFMAQLARFLNEPDRPIVLALSRPDERKNITTLVKAFGVSQQLQDRANLVVVAGNRNDIRDMGEGAQSVLTELLLLIDAYDLYGKAAFPKRHKSEEVPAIYRLVAASGGVFVNPALTEPFGLTLLEAAASGAPLVATENGGPVDIIHNCRNGLLVDPLDVGAMTEAILKILGDKEIWTTFSENGLQGVRDHYSWQAHADNYLSKIKPLLKRESVQSKPRRTALPRQTRYGAIISDIDQNLIGNPNALQQFKEVLQQHRKRISFGIATGRTRDSALTELKKNDIPIPDVLIASLGTEIYYTSDLVKDVSWTRHIDHLWTPNAVRRLLSELPGLELQPSATQSRFKVSYFYDAAQAPPVDEINALLRQNDQTVQVTLAFGQYLDILPIRASKGLALRYFAQRWDIPLEHILVAGGSGADEDMMRGNTLAVVVANRHHEELSKLDEMERVYFANKPHAFGIIEAIEHYDFFNLIETSLAE